LRQPLEFAWSAGGEIREDRAGCRVRGYRPGIDLRSRHPAVLESAGLLVSRRRSRYKFHDLHTEPLEHIVTR